jgi:hypothetical protein
MSERYEVTFLLLHCMLRRFHVSVLRYSLSEVTDCLCKHHAGMSHHTSQFLPFIRFSTSCDNLTSTRYRYLQPLGIEAGLLNGSAVVHETPRTFWGVCFCGVEYKTVT